MNKQFPLPTDVQYNNFAEYICEAHSWYKHIPLFEGGEFVFFLSKYAGGNYSKDSPRLHYAWTTSEEYRRRFGYLDYAYRMCDEEYFYRDTSPGLNIRPGKLGYSFNACPKNLDPCSVILYPFVSYDSDTLRSVILQNNYDEKLSADNSHPNRNQIIKWLDECQKSVGIWFI